MANAQSFPLLRLPNLAREHVVTVMDVREQYLFLTLFKKSMKVAKNAIRLISYVFLLKFYENEIVINIRKDWSSKWFCIMIYPNGKENRIVDRFAEIQMNVEDVEETSIELLNSLNEQFKVPSISFIFTLISDNFTKRFLEVVRNLKIPIYDLRVFGETLKADNAMCRYVMDNCQDARRLTNCCSTTWNFEWNTHEPFASEYCWLSSAPWLRFDHLRRIFINCRYFRSGDLNAQISEAEFNQFVKIWIEDSKLEFVMIQLRKLYSIQAVLSDIPKEPVQQAFIENKLRRFNAGEAFKIQQKSGNEAVVVILKDRYDYRGYVFHLTTHFNDRKCDFWDVEEEEEEMESEGDEGEEEEEEEEDFEDEEEEENLEDEDMEDEEDEEEIN